MIFMIKIRDESKTIKNQLKSSTLFGKLTEIISREALKSSNKA